MRERKPAAASWATISDEQRLFYMHHPTDRIAHTMAAVKSVVEHWLEMAQWVHHEGSIRRPIARSYHGAISRSQPRSRRMTFCI